MSEATYTQKLDSALTDAAKQLAHIRRIRLPEAWGVIAFTCRENAESSRGDLDAVEYWKGALAVCDRHLIDSSDRRWTS